MIIQLPYVLNVYVEVDTATGEVVRQVADLDSMNLDTDGPDNMHKRIDAWWRDVGRQNGELHPGAPDHEVDKALKIIADGAEWPHIEWGY